jgi:hypothetical protein
MLFEVGLGDTQWLIDYQNSCLFQFLTVFWADEFAQLADNASYEMNTFIVRSNFVPPTLNVVRDRAGTQLDVVMRR